MANEKNEAPTRNDVSRLLAQIEDMNRNQLALMAEVKRISSLPPPPAAAPYLEPTRQDKILALLVEATKEQRGLSTAEIASKLGLNRQQVQTAIIPLEREGRIVTMRPLYENTDKGPRRGHADVVFDRRALLDGWKLDGHSS
jgi:biotin operon repressor